MSAMTILPTNLFKLHGSLKIQIEKLNIIKDSDQELLRTSNSITYPTSTLVLDPYDTIYIDLESDNPDVEVGIVVLFVLSTDPLPVGYAVEPENQAEIKSLFSNVGGNSLLFPDMYRDGITEYADFNMLGYKDAYITLKLVDDKRGNINLGRYGTAQEWFQSVEPNFYVSSQKGSADNKSQYIYFRIVIRGRISDGIINISDISDSGMFSLGGGERFESDTNVTVEYHNSGTYRYATVTMVNKDPIPNELLDSALLNFYFRLDGTNASGYASSTIISESEIEGNLDTGSATLGLEVNTGNETWDPIAADQTNTLAVSENNKMKTISIGIISGIILPSGNNLLRLVLTTTGRARTASDGNTSMNLYTIRACSARTISLILDVHYAWKKKAILLLSFEVVLFYFYYFY